MGLKCQLLLTKANESVSYYKAGQSVIGTVKCEFDKPTEFTSATLSLIGSGFCQWQTKHETATLTHTGNEQYVYLRIHLLKAKQGEIVIIQPGSIEHPFHFVLPENLPSSYQGVFGNVTYKVELRFIKSGFVKHSKKFNTIIQVYGDIKPNIPLPLMAGFQKEYVFLDNKKFLNLKAEIGTTFVNAGENITVTLITNKETEMPITGVRTELISHITYMSNMKQEWLITKTVKGTVKDYPGIKEKMESTVTYVVPTVTISFSIQNSEIIARDYYVKLTFKLPFPHKNATIELPVVINKVHYETEDKSPSYWQHMSEEKYEDDSEPELKTMEGADGSFEQGSTQISGN